MWKSKIDYVTFEVSLSTLTGSLPNFIEALCYYRSEYKGNIFSYLQKLRTDQILTSVTLQNLKNNPIEQLMKFLSVVVVDNKPVVFRK